MRRLFLPASFGLLVACGGANKPLDPLARYPDRQFMTAEGRGPTVFAAADDARARLVASIRARLTARITVETSHGPAGERERVEHRIVTESSFAHAELIETPRALQRCPQEAECAAVAVMNREEAVGALVDAARDPSSRLRAAVDAAAAADDWAGFTVAVRAAEAAFAERAPLGWQTAVIAGGPTAAFETDRARYAALQRDRAARLTGLRIAVMPPGLDGPWADRVADAVAAGFTDLGVAAHRQPPAATDLVARTTAQRTCDRSALGPRCAIEITVRLGAADAPPLVVLEPPAVTAIDPRSPERAERRLADALAGGRLSAAFEAPLARVLPIVGSTP